MYVFCTRNTCCIKEPNASEVRDVGGFAAIYSSTLALARTNGIKMNYKLTADTGLAFGFAVVFISQCANLCGSCREKNYTNENIYIYAYSLKKKLYTRTTMLQHY